MPVFFQERLTKADLVANPRTIYAFEDTSSRTGGGGWAGVCRGRPNAVGIVTRHLPSKQLAASFSDSSHEAAFRAMAEDLLKLEHVLQYGGTVVFPTTPIGTRARLPETAPRLYGALRHCVAALAEIYGGAPCPW